ncbi:ATP-dependent sacrificial sulfur transferase LarE [Raineyella fluvialis]|nr:ATP-dependent sacrificial sulfur transferase LarE [Raineyella fluvialis]
MTLAAPDLLAVRLRALQESLAALPGLLVAFSGGADSAFLLAAAVRALGSERVLAATGVSGSLPLVERGPAADFAASLGVASWTPATHEIDREGYRANAGDRCYFCKSELLEVLTPEAERRGWPVATGTNADDVVAGFRPGIRAAAERGALTPLADAGITKDQVRQASAAWGLATWDKPAAACLASRIAYGLEVTPARLARVERAEAALRAALPGVRDLRVRDLDDHARVEIDRATLAGLDAAAQGRLREALAAEGLSVVEFRAFRSGSMNDLLADPARYR